MSLTVMIGSLLFCQVTLPELTEQQIIKIISRLQSKAEAESAYRHYTRGTTYAAPSNVQAPHVPFTHRLLTGGWKGPRSRITIRAPRMTNPKGCKCMPHCTKCDGNCDCCTCIFENPEHKVITSEIN